MANIYSIKSGLASDPTVWNGGVVPVSGDRVLISAGHTVTVDGTYTWGDDSTATISINGVSTTASLWVAGTLRFSRTVNTSLTLRGNIGWGANGAWDQGTKDDPIPANVTSVFSPNGSATLANLKYNFATPTAAGTTFKVWGAAKTVVTSFLDAAAQTDTVIRVADASGWQVGDWLTFGPASATATMPTLTSIRAITAITPTTTGVLVTLGAALPEGSSVGRRVANMTRNVRWMPQAACQLNISGSLQAAGAFEVGYLEVRNIGTNTSSNLNQATLSLTAAASILVQCEGVSAHNLGSVVGSTQTIVFGSSFVQGVGILGSSPTATKCLSTIGPNNSSATIGYMAVGSGFTGGDNYVGFAYCATASTSTAFPVSHSGIEVLACLGGGLWGSGGTSSVQASALLKGIKAPNITSLFDVGAFTSANMPKLDISDCDFGSVNGPAAQTTALKFKAGGIYYNVTFRNCTMPPQMSLARVGSNLETTYKDTVVSIMYRDSDPTKHERYTPAGSMLRDNDVYWRGASSVRMDCWYSGITHTYSFTFPLAAGQTATLVGAMRYNATYGTSFAPRVTASVSGQADVQVVAPAGSPDAWHPYSLTVSNTKAYRVDVTVTYSAASAANTTGAYCWFDGVPDSPWVETVRHFGYVFDNNVYRTADPRITMTEAAALALPVVVDHTAQTITVTGAVTTAEVFQACIADLCQTANLGRAVHITSSDGSDFTTSYSVVGRSNVTGAFTDATGRAVTITAPALIAGSRVQIYDLTSATEIYNGVLAGTGLTLATTYVSSHIIRLRAEHSTKLPLETVGVLTSSGLSFLDVQDEDTVYLQAGIDGSTVTEFATDGTNIEVDINDPDGITTVQRLYAWMQHYQTTEEGIRSVFFGALSAIDDVNFVIDQALVDMKLDNVSGIPLRVIGGHLTRKDGSTVIATNSGSIQMDPGKAYAISVSGSGGTTTVDNAAIANAVWASATRTLTSPAAPTAAQNASAVRTELATELARLDATVSSRLATASYTAPSAAPAATDVAAAVRTNLAAELARLDAAVSSRLAAASYTAPSTAPTAAQNAAAVRAELTPELARLDVAVSSRLAASSYSAITVDTSAIANAVWSNTTRTLTVASGLTPAQEAKIDEIKTKTDNLPTSPADQTTLNQVQTKIDATL